MRVIKEGYVQPPKKAVYTGMCLNCSCIVECDEGDYNLDYDFNANRDLPGTSPIISDCPTRHCGQIIRMVVKQEGDSLGYLL